MSPRGWHVIEAQLQESLARTYSPCLKQQADATVESFTAEFSKFKKFCGALNILDMLYL